MQQISDLNLKILLSQRLMGLVRKKNLVGIAPNQTSPPFAEREGFFCSQTAKATLSITNPWGFSSSRLFVKQKTHREGVSFCFAEREGFTLCIPNAPAGALQMASSFGAGALPNVFYGSIH